MIRCYITDSRRLGGVSQLLEAVPGIVARGVEWIQVREKLLSAAQLLELVASIIAIARPGGVKVLVNSRADVAMIADADGLHLPADSICVKSWRLIVPDHWLIGVSTHSVAQATEAERDGAGYVLFSPIFPSRSKPGYGPPLGLENLARASAALRIPVFALGGVSMANTASCIEAGAAGVAGISLFQE